MLRSAKRFAQECRLCCSRRARLATAIASCASVRRISKRQAASRGRGERPVIQPVYLDYSRIGGLPITRNERLQVAWYGDTTFLPFFFRLHEAATLHETRTWERRSRSRQVSTASPRLGLLMLPSGVSGREHGRHRRLTIGECRVARRRRSSSGGRKCIPANRTRLFLRTKYKRSGSRERLYSTDGTTPVWLLIRSKVRNRAWLPLAPSPWARASR